MATPTALETSFLDLINQTRAGVGAKPLSFDGELLDAADAHTAWMDQTDTFSHTGVNGTDPGARITDAGYGWQSYGENIAYVSGPLSEATVQQLHTNLVNSPGHYANIIKGSFEEIGIGLKEGTINGHTVTFVTEDFGTPNATERAEPNDVGTTVTTPAPTVPDPVVAAPTTTDPVVTTPATPHDAAVTPPEATDPVVPAPTTTAEPVVTTPAHDSADTAQAPDPATTVPSTADDPVVTAPTTDPVPQAPTTEAPTATPSADGQTTDRASSDTDSPAWHGHGDSFAFNTAHGGRDHAWDVSHDSDGSGWTHTDTNTHAADQGAHGCGWYPSSDVNAHADAFQTFGAHHHGHGDFII
ncbi:CAP domain-containing protein [Methylobacterium nigriterrae]|uniref:CAP domain-containing protein n=1 Tax=Methylobacterium nigriterrae TaxID=3127512 RepID=UPI00301334DF